MSKATKPSTKTPEKAAPPPPTAAAPAKKSRFNLDGLEGLGLTSIATGNGMGAASATPAAIAGVPLQLPVSEIREDPDQPRRQFDEDALAELTDSVREHGIKTPISVKSKGPDGLHLINYGARRYRAAQRAGLATVPAFIDDTHDDYAQVVENVQRDDLRPLEIARFIAAKLKTGIKAKDIGTKFGKPKAWVSKHAALIDAPEYIAKAADAGLVRSYDALYELTVHVEQHPDHGSAVESFLNRTAVATQGEVRQFLQSLTQPKVAPAAPEVSLTKLSGGEGTGSEPPGASSENPAGKGGEGGKASQTNAPTPSPTRTSTPAEQDRAAAQHATDTFFRTANAEDHECSSTATTKTPNEGGARGEGKGATIRAGFDQGQGEIEPAAPTMPETHPIQVPLLMFRKGSRGGTVNLSVATRYGWVMVRYEGDAEDVEEKADSLELAALIDGAAAKLHVEH